jgi:hypothetical protein
MKVDVPLRRYPTPQSGDGFESCQSCRHPVLHTQREWLA